MYTINSNINKYQMSNPSSLHLSLDQYIQIHPNNRGKEEKSLLYIIQGSLYALYQFHH